MGMGVFVYQPGGTSARVGPGSTALGLHVSTRKREPPRARRRRWRRRTGRSAGQRDSRMRKRLLGRPSFIFTCLVRVDRKEAMRGRISARDRGFLSGPEDEVRATIRRARSREIANAALSAWATSSRPSTPQRWASLRSCLSGC